MNQNPVSAELFDRALKVLPGGVSRNTILRKPHPFYAKEGSGCTVTDFDGVQRIDFANNMASLIHGHAHPAIVEAVTRQLSHGTAFTMGTKAEILLAEELVSRISSVEKIRFTNSGTEAVMGCIKVARAFTGRQKIAKAEGCYHGFYDFAEVSQTAKPANWGPPESPQSVPVALSTPKSALDEVIIIPFNDPETALEILNRHRREIACILVDPMPHRAGLIRATTGFIEKLREWTNQDGSLLVFDEVITFRSEFGGAQEWYPAKPDLTALGKIIGGGFPVGAIAGRSEIMEVLNPLSVTLKVPHSGTFSANPISMTAGLTALSLFDREAVDRLNRLGNLARSGIAETIRNSGLPLSVTGEGSMFRLHLTPSPPRNYREAYTTPAETALITRLLDHFFENGFMLINTLSAALSTPVTKREINRFIEVLADALPRFEKDILGCAETKTIHTGATE